MVVDFNQRFILNFWNQGKFGQDRLLNLLDRKLTYQQRDSCEGQLMQGECLVAVKSMAFGKTPEI
jgi:hypothetical protein